VTASWPLANRAPEALQALLRGDRDHAQVRLLTLSEMCELSTALLELNGLARQYLDTTCMVCDVAVTWDPNEPTGQEPRWEILLG